MTSHKTYYTLTPLFLFLFLFSNSILAQDINEVNCLSQWEESRFGFELGSNFNMLNIDINKDGFDDLIVNAEASIFRDYGHWHAFLYNPSISGFDKVFSSETHPREIQKLSLGNVDQDLEEELIVAYGDQIFLYDISTSFDLVKKIVVEELSGFTTEIVDLKIFDINQNGNNEIIISTDNELLILDPETDSTLLYEENIEASYFDVGQVDSDSRFEIAFSNGSTYEIINFSLQLEYDFFPLDQAIGWIELANIDNDPEDEAIILSDEGRAFTINIASGNLIQQYDYSFFPLRIVADVADVDLDGNLDLIIADRSGVINIYDPLTSELKQTIEHDVEAVTGFTIADFNNNGKLEIVAALGPLISGNNEAIQIIDFETGMKQWETFENGGDFNNFKIEDISGDGKNELIVLASINQEAFNHNLLIYDEVTKRLIQNKRINLPFNKFFQGVQGFEIADVGLDGDQDFILFGGSGFEGVIWVIDGTTLEFELQLNLNTTNQFLKAEVGDVNTDGIEELIIVDNEKVYEFALSDMSIQWTSEVLFFANDNLQLEIKDIDSNNIPDIIILTSNLNILESRLIKYTSSETYDALTFADFEGNGIEKILLYEGFAINSTITAIDPIDFNSVSLFELDFRGIEKIQATDLNHDGISEIVFTTGDIIGVFNQEGDIILSQFLGRNVGLDDNFILDDINGDGKINPYVGTANKLIEFNASCLECINFNPIVVGHNPTCEENNGTIQLIRDSLFNTTFEFEGNIVFDSIPNLDEGSYQIVMTSNTGCRSTKELILSRESLSVQFADENIICEGKGGGTIIINQGIAPYSYLWDEMQGDSINFDLMAGTHQVVVTDENNCEEIIEFEIDSLFVSGELDVLKNDCNNASDGVAQIEILEGQAPFSYSWSQNISSQATASELEAGVYSVTVTDNNQCIFSDSIEVISSILEIESSVQNLQCFDGGESGMIQIIVLEGSEPVSYSWNTGPTSPTILTPTPNTYSVTIEDNNGCMLIQQFDITSPPRITIESNITNDDPATPEDDGDIIAQINGGVQPYSFLWSTGDTTAIVQELSPGNYSLTVTDANDCMQIEEFTIDFLSSTSQLSETSFTISPNPTRDELYINWEKEEVLSIELYDYSGRKLSSINETLRNQMDAKINTNNIPTGFYILKIKTKNHIVSEKIIIQRE